MRRHAGLILFGALLVGLIFIAWPTVQAFIEFRSKDVIKEVVKEKAKDVVKDAIKDTIRTYQLPELKPAKPVITPRLKPQREPSVNKIRATKASPWRQELRSRFEKPKAEATFYCNDQPIDLQVGVEFKCEGRIDLVPTPKSQVHSSIIYLLR